MSYHRRRRSRRASDPRASDARGTGRTRRRILVTAIVMASLSLTLAAVFGKRGPFELMAYKQEHERVAADIAWLRAEIFRLGIEIDALQNDPLAIERVAREELTLARPGEVVVFLQGESRRSP